MLLSILYIFKVIYYLFNFLQTVITAKGFTEGKVATSLVNYKIILF